MTADRTRPRLKGLRVLVALVALAGVGIAPAEADTPVPKGFPKASFVTGDTVTGDRSSRGVMLHAQWIDGQGKPQKYFRQAKRFPWPKGLTVQESAFRIHLKGVRYPGKLELGVFRKTGPAASPAGFYDLYSCTFPSEADDPCRWVPAPTDDGEGWDVMVDHAQAKGHLYIVAVGSWADPRDPPSPVGKRGQVATWLFHAKLAS